MVQGMGCRIQGVYTFAAIVLGGRVSGVGFPVSGSGFGV
jgi:hypothetical protein